MYNLHFKLYLISATFCVKLQVTSCIKMYKNCIKMRERVYVCVLVCIHVLYRNPRWKCNAETHHGNMPSMWEGARGSVFDCLSRKAARAAFVSEVM